MTEAGKNESGTVDAELEHLIQMLGDIERNLAFNSDAQERIVDHLQRFWAPSMRQRIIAYSKNNGAALGELSRAALRKLASA